MQIENINVRDIKPYKGNAKKHPEEQIDLIANSISEFGFKQPLVLDSDNVVIIGHGRLLASKKLGLEDIPCVYADDLTKEQIKALRLADNKVAESEWDFDLLDSELEDIFELDMSEFGFDVDNISPDDFGDDFTLPDGDKSEICQITFTLHERQKELVEYAISLVKDNVTETFGNTNSNGNALYEVVKQWADAKK